MKKILGLVLMVVLALVGCNHGNKVDPNAPLELTVENLAGKWVLPSDPNSWVEFTKDNKYSDSDNLSGTFEITSTNTVKIDTVTILGTMSNDFTVIVYKDHILFNNEKHIRAK